MKKKIYVICPPFKFAVGGIKQLYRLVDLLNDLGYDANIVLKNRRYKAQWFDQNTKLKYFPYLFFLIKKNIKGYKLKAFFRELKFIFLGRALPEKDSILIYPDYYAPFQHSTADNQFIIFNQNCYLTYHYHRYENNPEKDPHLSNKLLGCIVVSTDSENYLHYPYPHLNIYKYRVGISETFRFSGTKKKQIAFMPRKLPEDSNQVLNILRVRGMLDGWEIVRIHKMDEKRVADVFSESAIFLSFNDQEGLGLPPLEAMRSGCYVIGYTGRGGEEYFDPRYSSPVPYRDIISYAKEVERIIKLYNNDSTSLLDKTKLASEFVQKEFSLQAELMSLQKICKEIL